MVTLLKNMRKIVDMMRQARIAGHIGKYIPIIVILG
jgi:hypothetical protein